MALFEKMKDSISVAGKGVSHKAKTATESAKINNQIRANERMIEKLTYQVGVQCVEQHISEENSEYAELFKEILRLREENREYQSELQKITAVNVCPQCGFGNHTTAKFCISCGAPLADMRTDGKSCSACGYVNAADALFCVECGEKLPAEDTADQSKEEMPENVCANCGAVLGENVLFCTKCGTKRK